jgi:putative endopeptidase
MSRPRCFITASTFLALAALIATAAPGRAAPPAWEVADMDTTVAPCTDFFHYANGGWLTRTEIPAAFAGWGSFAELAERNREQLRAILEAAAAERKAKPGSDMGRIGAYYRAAMDSAAIEKAGLAPAQPLLDLAAAAGPGPALGAAVGELQLAGVPALFGFGVRQDPKNSELMIAFASQGGLGLPDRDFYTRTDSGSVALREAYVRHVARMFELAGDDAAVAARRADAVMSIETALAEGSMTNVERRDPVATYHKVPLDTLRAWAPRFDWGAYLERGGITALDSVNVTQPGFFRGLDAQLAARPVTDWQDYLRWNVLRDAAPFLGSAFVSADFEFASRLSGAREMLPRWQRALRWTDADLGDLLGREYVKRHFPAAAREEALRLIHHVEAAFESRLEALDWMSETTRQRALEKLHAFVNHIGYPEKWREYEGVELGPSLYANHVSAQRAESRRQLAKLGRPVDRGEWRMTPPTVNAFYNSSLNSINFPAGILQPPFFDPSWDEALNYGAIGAVIGHEITHGFDDRGRQFDGAGNLRDWWTDEDAANYKARAALVVEQFDGYTVLDGLHVNGRLTLGENIADLGGLAVAHSALEIALEGKPRTRIDGFTPEQRFFLSWARVWRRKDRDEALRTLVQTNSHSPALWRVNGPLSNLPEFQRAFGCAEGDPMVGDAEARARIW